MMGDRVLGDHEIHQFIEEGYVCVKQAIDPETITRGLAELMVHSASANRGDWVRAGLRGEVKLPTERKYEPKLGPPQEDWLPIDWTLRTDNLEKGAEPA